MNLFGLFKKEKKKVELFEERLKRMLDRLAELGIKAKDDDFTDWIVKEWGYERIASDPYGLLLYTLGGERESGEEWLPLSNDIYSFDTECVEDDAYEEVLRRLSAITKGEVILEHMKSNVDHEKEVVELSFTYGNKTYHWKPEYQTDWFDQNVIRKLNHLLREQNSAHYFYNSSGDQYMSIIFTTEEIVNELNQIVSVPFAII